MRCFLLLIPASIPLLVGPMHAGDTAWQLHLDRASAVGGRASISSSGTQNRRVETTSPNRPGEVTEEKLQVTYKAVHQVQAVDPKGRATEMLLQIERLTTDDGSGLMEQFTAGTLITAKAAGDRTHYQLGHEALEGTLADALDLAGAKLPNIREPSEDAVFLNQTPRHPGERWNADPKRLAEAIAATSPFIIDPEASSAEISFDELLTEGTVPALSTTTKYKIIPAVLRGSSAGEKLAQSHVTSTTVRLFPLDPSLPIVKETLETSMKLLQNGPLNSTTETTFNREVTRHCDPLPDGELPLAPPAGTPR